MKPLHIRTLLLVAISVDASVMAAAPRRILPPRMETGELRNYLPADARIEVRLDGDITGDGIADVAAIGTSEEERKLVVLAGYAGETDLGHRPIGETKLDPSPLGSASLKLVRGVLIIEDLSGGTTATASVYRWRYDRAADKLRLIGDDVTLYSRTYAHDGVEVSTNRLTGMRLVTRNRLARGKVGNAAYLPGKPETRKIARSPVYMGTEPSPDDTLEKVR